MNPDRNNLLKNKNKLQPGYIPHLKWMYRAEYGDLRCIQTNSHWLLEGTGRALAPGWRDGAKRPGSNADGGIIVRTGRIRLRANFTARWSQRFLSRPGNELKLYCLAFMLYRC
jgi:hypothetical protein